ncbi:NACHT domain-containing protein [Pseudanabaena yagii]|uniref:NACHT domain-containing protein n=1 Tax=Pseudanabaena yagii GIHE-NHR1 TaxID=2722753 RepID=A0ABX1LLR5_9CYAN|nr:NACHT domain-containing protein [Pseudanabaena yagii]NMF57068.1 NACHT domain-containing protein [Pseudanabaena yagii GIHE-NHR1]
MGQLRDRSLHFTPKGIALIEEAMQGKDWDKSQLAEQVEISYESICRYLRGERPPQRKNIEIIAKRLGLKPIDLVNPDEWTSSTKDSETKTNLVDWRSVSKGMLENLKRLTTEALTAGDGIRFDFDDVFVPLGVVERQERTKRKENDGAPDRGSELYEEKVTPITHDEFFEDVLLRGNTRYSDGKRIAVIGEAGAGKTTQLQKIGSWLLEKSDDIPIWISLTDLGAKSLREYLFENWVREASGEIEAAPQAWKDSLGDAIASGKVWLLLDGVDEMTVSNPLSYLSTQLKEGWLKNVRVVLTCRVNVWDGGKNALTGFDVYRNLDFDYPDDVYKFIGKWFARAPELAGSLTQALEQSGKERIRDMVKNPLRLTLLCFSWQKLQGGLPETKAGLYEWFVNTFYDWKREEVEKVTGVEINSSKIKELNKALGELAKAAIDSESSRFRLTETFIRNNMNPALFDLADKLNWLNKVGDAAENSLESVYAFYHPSFQEYFAALAINDWRFFLPSSLNDLKSYDYPIFDARWDEVILLWFGREDIEREEKEDFISALIDFDDGCGDFPEPINRGFYSFRAYLYAAICLQEFRKCRNSKLIIKQIIEWALIIERLVECDELIEIIQDSICGDARFILEKIQQDLTEEILLEFIQTYQSEEWLRWDFAKSLVLISNNIQTQKLAIKEIIDLMNNSECKDMRLASIESLGYLIDDLEELKSINIDNEIKRLIVYALIELIQDLKCESTCTEAARVLSGIITDDEKNIVILCLIDLMKKATYEETISQAVQSLQEIATDSNSKIFATKHLINLINKTEDEDILRNVIYSLGIIANDDESRKLALPCLIQLLDELEDEWLDIAIIDSLRQIAIDHSSKQSAIIKLLFLIRASKDNGIVIFAANNLALISTDNDEKMFALSTIINLIKTSIDEDVKSLGAWSLGNIACDSDSRAISVQVLISLIDKYQDDSDLSDVVESLILIAEDSNFNPLVLPAISKIIKKTNNDVTLELIANRIVRIDTDKEGKKNIVSSLIEIINKSEDEYTNWQAIRSLKKIANDSEMMEFVGLELISLLQKTNCQSTLKNIARCLGNVSINIECKNLVISTLNKLFLESNGEDIGGSTLWQLGNLLKDTSSELSQSIVANFSNKLTFDNYKENIVKYKDYYNTVWCCAQNMSYPAFYKAWHLYRNLEGQLMDCEAIQKELDRNTDHPEIRRLVVDICQLEQESDPNVIAEEIAIKIFDSLGREIPEINRVSNLKRELINLKRVLGVEKLAIALYGKNANEAINRLCQNLITDSIHIYPFTGEKSTQQLTKEVKAWLRRINLEYN